MPPEYLTRTLWVRWDARLVRIFNHRFEQIVVHVRREPGRFSTLGEHVHPHKISGLERGAEYLLNKTSLDRPARASVGSSDGHRARPGRHAGAARLVEPRQATCHPSPGKSLRSRSVAWRVSLRTIRTLLKRPGCKQEPLPFLDEHPIIRPLDDYAQIVARAIQRQARSPIPGRRFGKAWLGRSRRG